MNQNNDVLIPFLNIVFWIFHNYVQVRRKQFGIRGGGVGGGGGGVVQHPKESSRLLQLVQLMNQLMQTGNPGNWNGLNDPGQL